MSTVQGPFSSRRRIQSQIAQSVRTYAMQILPLEDIKVSAVQPTLAKDESIINLSYTRIIRFEMQCKHTLEIGGECDKYASPIAAHRKL